jgi:hypothetical protein
VADFPRYVRYLERLTPELGYIEVEQPQSRDDAFDLLATINRLAIDDPVSWKFTVRMHTATSWYMLGLFLSGAQRLDPFTGRPEMDCEFLWNFYHEMQYDGDGVLDKSARGHHKTHIRGYVGITSTVINDPNEIIAFIAHQKMSAAKHCNRTGKEWETNVELKAAWDDVFFADPKKDPDCSMWNQETGYTVKRSISAALPTLSWYAIEEVPVGARVSLFVFDDVETEATVESDHQREKILERFASFQELAGRVPRVWVNGTHFHPNGLIKHLESSGAFRVRCHAAEDLERQPPDIAKMYDECGGKLPLRDENRIVDLPPAIRDIRLDGYPVFLHPLEVAWKRLRALATPGGLANYYRQNMGDALAGQEKRFKEDWIRYYDCKPEQMAEGAFLYILVDPSKGIGDPTHARVEACRSDGTIAWVGGLRKKIAPSDFGKEMWQLGCLWEGFGTIKEYRFEEVAQSSWCAHFIAYCEARRHWPGNIGPGNVKEIGGRALNWGGGSGQKRVREWLRLEPMYRNGKRIWPREGVLWAEDETGRRFDLMVQYREEEFKPFPMPMTDDGLDSDALLMAPDDPKRGVYALEFPESDEEAQMRELAAYRRGRRGAGREDGADGDWMNEGL